MVRLALLIKALFRRRERNKLKYCSNCGAKVIFKIPEGDNRERYCCDNCGMIHYENPRCVVGTIPIYLDNGVPKVMLCKRGIEPRLGYWTLPAGFLENGETSAEGALRETVEESCAQVENLKLFRILNVAATNQIHIFFSADMPKPEYEVTPESTEINLYSFDDIPWRKLAFPTVHRALKDFVDEYPQGDLSCQMDDIGRIDWKNLDLF